ncbi:MAG: DUF4159 domain-containing protein [Flavobacteriales bacterium]|nr:DUF4159 domain-containing protein [Flavobacteriales bacterium]
MKRHEIFTVVFILFSVASLPGQSTIKLALLKYGGGGDWYANPTSLPNLAKFCNQELKTNIALEPALVEPGSETLFLYPFLHITGHGNIFFTAQEAVNLRKYLLGGGFLHISDNYGIDQSMRREMKKVLPEAEWIILPAQHPIYHQKFDFPNGLPKIHEHDNKPAQGFGIIENGRLVVFYDYESDLGDGWEDAEVHKDSEDTRMKALRMGVNLIQYVFMTPNTP